VEGVGAGGREGGGGRTDDDGDGYGGHVAEEAGVIGHD
jgi:hypothetical protein